MDWDARASPLCSAETTGPQYSSSITLPMLQASITLTEMKQEKTISLGMAFDRWRGFLLMRSPDNMHIRQAINYVMNHEYMRRPKG